MTENNNKEKELNFYDFFTPLTTKKAIWWLIIVGFAVYLFGLFNGFVMDDGSQIRDNAFLYSLSNIPSLFKGSTFYTGGQLVGVFYRPIPTAFFLIIISILGASPFWLHAIQLIFHIGNSILVFLIFTHFFKKRLALLFSLIFIIHPAISETVFYISAMHEVLFLFFGLLALWIGIIFKGNYKFPIIATILLLSLLSKETGILFILIVGIYFIIFLKKEFLKYLISSFATILLYVFLRFQIANVAYESQNAHVSDASLIDRLITMPSIFLHYLLNFIFPANLSSSYQWLYQEIKVTTFLVPTALLVILLIGVFLAGYNLWHTARKNFWIFTFLAIWFFIGIGAHLQLTPLDATAADRWFYFPIVGLLGMIGVMLYSSKIPPKSNVPIYIILVVISLLSVRTIVRSADWKDDFTLASRDIKVSPQSHDLENRLAVGLVMQGRFKEAKEYAESAAGLYPSLLTLNTLGAVYLNLGEYKKSKDAFAKALKYGDFPPIYENLSLLEIIDTDYDQARIFIKKSLHKFPSNPKLWLYLAIVEYQSGNKEEAKAAITRATQFSREPIIIDTYRKISTDQPLNIKL